ncbi:MAG: VanZ family protein [Saprospiraceae bacterium]|nr:VanZ family protein [Saprospiraceae bacterium]
MTLRPFLLPFFWLVTLTVMSVMPSLPAPEFKLVAPDKLVHAFVYGVLVWLGLRAFRRYRPGNALTLMQGFGMFTFASAWGAMMEYIQGAYFPGRFFEFDDMIANTAGAAMAWLLFFILYRKS